MAGDWMKVEKATPRKPEILRLSVALGIHPDQAFGLCFRFWSWCDDQLESGNALGVTETLVDALVERNGFASALISVGWLQVRSGSLVIPNFDRHLSESAKKRALTAKRVAKSKAKKGNAPNVTLALPEKRREENIKTPISPPDEIRERLGEALTFQSGADDYCREWCLAYPAHRRAGEGAIARLFPDAITQIQQQRSCNFQEAFSYLLDRTKTYAKSWRGQHPKLCWGAKTWLEDTHWTDPPEAWMDTDSESRPNVTERRLPSVAEQQAEYAARTGGRRM